MLGIKNVSEENLEDTLMVCSGSRPYASSDDPILKKGREFKRKWLLEMLKKHGPCMKIAYLDKKPAAQILFYPEETMPFLHNPRKDVVYLKCIYISSPEDRGIGVGTTLLRALVDECHTGLDCLEGRPCQFIVTRPFLHEGKLPLSDFYEKCGFKKGHEEMFLEIKGKYVPREISEYRPLPEDSGKIVQTYYPDCEWGYFAAMTIKEIFQGKHPNLPIKTFNCWEKPEEYKKRDDGLMGIAGGIIINAKVPKDVADFWTEREAFTQDIEKMLRE